MDAKLNRITLLLCPVTYLIYAFLAIKSGGTFLGLISFIACFYVGILSCGDFLKDKLIKTDGLFNNIGISFCLGVLFLFINFILFDTLGAKRLMIVIPLAIGVFNFYNKHSSFNSGKLVSGVKWPVYLTYIGFAIAFIFCGMLPFARPDLTKNFFLHQDMVWSAGNAASAYLGFPLTDMRFAHTTLNYHYLNDVTAGMLAVSTGQPAYETFCLYWYMNVGVVLVAAIYQVARNYTDNKYVASLMPFLVLFGVGKTGMFQYITNINGQGGATLTLCGGLLMLKLVEETDFASLQLSKKITIIASFIGMGFVISMFKSTIGALFVLANIAACVVGVFTRKTKIGNVLYATGLAIGFGVAYKFIFSQAVNNLVFSGVAGIVNLPKELVGFATIGVIIYAMSLLHSLLNFKQLSFMQLCANAMFVGGMVAYCVYSHYSYSQVYFALIAIPMMWLASAEFVGLAADNNKKALPVFMACVLAMGMYNSTTLLSTARSGVQALLRVYNLRISDYDEGNITADDYNAMLWLRQNTRQDEIFATNRNNKYFDAAEGVFHYYSAASQRACYLESYRYCMDYSGQYWEVRRRLENVSDNIFHTLSESQAFALAKEEKIDYLVVFNKVNDPQWSAAPVYANDTVLIYKVI